ncbi:UNVERIFIED_CONTAM: hypothetical protein K2H54_031823 [Gekko kuhli]
MLTPLGDVIVRGTLTPPGETIVRGTLTPLGEAIVRGTLTPLGEAIVRGTLTPLGEAIVRGMLTPLGDAIVRGMLTPLGEAIVRGTLTPLGDAIVRGTLTPLGEAIVRGTLTPLGDAIVRGTLTPLGDAIVRGTLTPLGEAIVRGTLTPLGEAIVRGTLTPLGDVIVRGTLTPLGDAIVRGTLTPLGEAIVRGTLTPLGDAIVRGTLTPLATILSSGFLLAPAQVEIPVAVEPSQPLKGQGITLTPGGKPTYIICSWSRGGEAEANRIFTYIPLLSPPVQQNGPRFTGRETGGPGCSLHIGSLMLNDTGDYTVSKVEMDGYEMGRVHIAVLASILSSCFLPTQVPTVALEPPNPIAGKNVTLWWEGTVENVLFCRWYRGESTEPKVWIFGYHPDYFAQEIGDTHTQQETGGLDCSMHIRSLRLRDTGNCRVMKGNVG